MAYDVVIAGAGAAGCIMANRLSEDPDRSVLLVEAGPDFRNSDECPEAVRDEWSASSEHMWYFEGVRTPSDANPIPIVRGKIVGGSSSVNGMAYQRGAAEDYNSWGSDLWTYDSLVPFFKNIERFLDGDDDSHGLDGQVPLRRLPRDEWSPSAQAFHQSSLDLGFQEVDDLDSLNKTERDGVGPTLRNSHEGTRMSTAFTYLLPARDRANLTVQGNAVVDRVLIEGNRATGIEMTVDGQKSVVHADQVILCAGGIGSPQILTVSGVGPADVLDRLGIPTIEERPGVGRNLSDHPLVPVNAWLNDGVEKGDPRFIVGLEYTAEGSPDRHDMLLLTCSGRFGDSVMADVTDGTDTELSIYAMLQVPESIGEIEVLSPNAADPPRVHYRYLQSERDRERLRGAVRLAVRILEGQPFKGLIAERKGPAHEQLQSDAALDEWILENLATTLHGAGTCTMGPADDRSAVVDDHGRVHGIDGLRVADLSIAPFVVRSTTNATAMVIAERVAALFRADHPVAAATAARA